MSNFQYRVLSAICILGVLNFIALWVVSIVIGGDAFNGAIVDGHFYLGSHGKFTEVDEATFTYSLWQVRSVFITHPLAMLAGYLAHKGRPEARWWKLKLK